MTMHTRASIKRSLSSEYDRLVVENILDSEIGALGEIISARRMAKEVEFYKSEMRNEIINFLKSEQHWRMTGELVDISDGFIEDIGLNMSLAQLRKKIGESRASFEFIDIVHAKTVRSEEFFKDFEKNEKNTGTN